MTIIRHNLAQRHVPAAEAGHLRLLPIPAFIWAGARLTSCGFMAAPAAS